MIGIAEIRAAARHIEGRVHRTPVLSSRTLSERTGATVLLKPECLQRTGSFKARGVLNRLRRLDARERQRGLITISAGNHAQAVAWAAAQEAIHATVVMPEHAVRSKVEASRTYGADVVLHGDVFAAFQRVDELRAQHGFTLIHPFDDDDVIAGQGTVGLELCEDAGTLDLIVVPVGGGGLIAGIATAVRALQPSARVVGVEPVGSTALRSALDAGHPVRLVRIDSIADGLGAPMTTERVLDYVRANVDDVVTVTDDAITDALCLLLERCKLLAEPAGAAALAALLAGAVSVPAGGRVAVIVSGGNIDLETLRNLLPEPVATP